MTETKEETENPQRSSIEAFDNWFYENHFENTDKYNLVGFFEARDKWIEENFHELREDGVYNLRIKNS